MINDTMVQLWGSQEVIVSCKVSNAHNFANLSPMHLTLLTLIKRNQITYYLLFMIWYFRSTLWAFSSQNIKNGMFMSQLVIDKSYCLKTNKKKLLQVYGALFDASTTYTNSTFKNV